MRVLFIGNSHTFFNDMPHLFASMCRELTGETPEATMLAYGGRSLQWHCDEYFALRFAILYGNYDYCVLQQQAHPFPGVETTETWGMRIIELCKANGVTPVVYMTWAEKAKPENFAVMESTYTALASATGALLAPVGRAFDRLRREHPELELYYRDGEHASPAGDYLIAAMLAGLLTKKDVRALSSSAIDFRVSIDMENNRVSALESAADCRITLDEAEAALLRATVQEELEKEKSE